MATLRQFTRFPRMRTGLVVALVGVLAVAGNAVAQSGAATGSGSDDTGEGPPTIAAAARDLQRTTTATGQLERTDERTIGYGGTVTPVSRDAEGTSDTTDAAGDGATDEAASETAAASDTIALGDAGITLASAKVAGGPTEAPPCEPDEKKKRPAARPCEPEDPSEEPREPEDPSEAPSEDPTDEPSPDPSPTPSEPDEPSEPPSAPGEPGEPTEPAPRPEPTPTEPLVPPAPDRVPGVQQPTTPGAQRQQAPSAVMPGAQQPAGTSPRGGPTAQGAPATAGNQGQAGIEPLVGSAVLTSITDPGTDVKRGTTLYEADAEPVIALIGTIPMWRKLEVGVDNCADVRQLERNLDKLGYGDDLTIDREFTDATADAVEAWEDDLGREDPDGVVEPGEVTYLTDAGTVIAQEAAVGETLNAGTAVLTVSGASDIVTADVPVDEVGAWPRGAEVKLRWDDGGEATTGAISSIGRDTATSDDLDTVEVTIALDAPERQRPNHSQATASLTAERRPGAVAVPVAAIVAGANGQPAVRVVEGTSERVVEVTTGLVDGGWIEVLDGISAGDVVRLPG